MNTENRQLPVGGVERAVLHPATSVVGFSFRRGACSCTFADDGFEVPLCDDRSLFEERLEAASPPASVRHTLTLVAERTLASLWSTATFCGQALLEGFVAEVYLADGRTLIVGLSEALGAEQPLRLASLTHSSGLRRSQTPTLTLTLTSEDVEFALPKRTI